MEVHSITLRVNIAKLLSHVLLIIRLLSTPCGCFHVFLSSVLADTLQAATDMYIFTCVLYIHTGFIEEQYNLQANCLVHEM